ncbi:MerR family transcriptional regulator [Kitasatospora xanthocidica]|uniref:MerR family transcriptional regulator n=1 Tax=Kitasatospora xanthocidica TaxID=83382 RepID=A0A373A575_9ACTN|nr:MerR family transcriptional regulator [Kitasatospora xanthocidica]RGD62852.1 MerR family transcriptional regulator [Kitasatospora xanthocidica]
MNGDALWTIGELARRTGLTVKTVRFYSDQGIVSPADRNPAGHRRYGPEAVARLELVLALRELGLGLPAIRRVVGRELTPADVAAAQAEAIDLQIRVLRLRRAVLGAVARLGSTPEELTLVHRLARLTEDERGRLIGEFLTGVFGGIEDGGVGDGGVGEGGRFAAVARSLTPELPELPEEPSVEQVEAWVELAQLAGDAGFRALLRGLAEAEAAEAAGTGLPRPGLAVAVRELAGPAVAAGVETGSAEAAAVVAVLVERYGRCCAGAVPGEAGAVRDRLAERLGAMADPRRERYLELLAVVNGWAAPESWAAEVDWAVRAVA